MKRRAGSKISKTFLNILMRQTFGSKNVAIITTTGKASGGRLQGFDWVVPNRGRSYWTPATWTKVSLDEISSQSRIE